MVEQVKSATKQMLAGSLSRISDPILVNSFGRSGSTVLFRSVVCAAASHMRLGLRPYMEKVIGGVAWNLNVDSLHKGRCYKTHDYPRNRSRPVQPLVLYAFGNPIHTAASVLRKASAQGGQQWYRHHCEHLHVPYHAPTELLSRDSLRLEQHIRQWLEQDKYRVAMIRYETMWDNSDAISEFLGFTVELPAQRPRNTQVDLQAGMQPRLERTYGGLKAFLDTLPDFSIVDKRRRISKS